MVQTQDLTCNPLGLTTLPAIHVQQVGQCYPTDEVTFHHYSVSQCKVIYYQNLNIELSSLYWKLILEKLGPIESCLLYCRVFILKSPSGEQITFIHEVYQKCYWQHLHLFSTPTKKAVYAQALVLQPPFSSKCKMLSCIFCKLME